MRPTSTGTADSTQPQPCNRSPAAVNVPATPSARRNLTDKDVQRLRELFGAMDADKDGLIDAGDLHSALDRVGAAIDAAEMEELIRASDINGGSPGCAAWLIGCVTCAAGWLMWLLLAEKQCRALDFSGT